MTAIDRAALIEAAAKAAFMVGHIGGDTWEKTDRKSREYRRDQAAAVLPVIVSAVLKPIRELHREQFQFCRDCDADYPCPTVRLLDQIETDSKGGELLRAFGNGGGQ